MDWQKKNSIVFLILFFLMLSLTIESGINDGLEKAIHLFEDGKFPEAKEIFQSYIEENDKIPEAAFYLGRIYLIEDSLDEAIDWLKKAVKLNENDSENHHWLGITYGQKAQKVGLLKKAGWANKMREEVERAVELDGDNINARFSLMQYYVNAPGFMGGSKEKAKLQAEEIKKRDSIRGHRAFSMIYVSEQKYDLAEAEYKAFEKECGDSPDFFQFYNDYGYFLLRQKRYDEAIEKFEKQVRLAPDNANAHDSLGDGYRAAGRLQDTADAYRKALEIDPNFTAAKRHLEKVEKEIESREGSDQR